MDVRTRPQVPFLTVEEVHAALGGVVARSTLYRHLNDGVVPGLHLGGRWYVAASWLDDVLQIGRS